ncbi:threonine--tRNA ligase, partial [bacterium]|nr:threonine--tRNA ligase [bacterium]
MVAVTLPDGAVKQSQAGISWKEFIQTEIGEGLARNALAVVVDGTMVDVSTEVSESTIAVVTPSSPEALDLLRHSTAHIMADAVKQLFPSTKVTIGPSIDNGFYYDFDSEHRFVEEDLTTIQKKMKEIIKAKRSFNRRDVSADEAKQLFGKMGETYKNEIIDDLGETTVSLYTHGDFVDLCRGPHLPHTGFAKVFRLLSIAGAYWRGDEKNKMLQRIYGTAFFSKSDLKEYLDMLQEARERDHRKVGKELDLFEMSDEVGPGLALWTPKGGVIRTVIENFWRKEHYRNGYDIVYTPHIGRGHLWETSGHLDFYRDG